MSAPHIIDLTPFSDEANYSEFRKITSGRRAVRETDAIEKLKMGYNVRFEPPENDSVKCQFTYGVLEILTSEIGEDVLDQVDLDWWNSDNHVEGYKRRRAKERVEKGTPVWSSPFQFFIPQSSNQFRVEQDWKFDLTNHWYNRKILIEVYGTQAVKDGIFHGRKVGNYDKITNIIALPGSTFKITKINASRSVLDVDVTFEKNAKFMIDGILVTGGDTQWFSPSLHDFSKLVCSINELSREKL
jgi:hypothetical protein